MSEVFYSYWYDGELPPYARMSINSYVRNGHTLVLYTHGKIPNAPHGCIIGDAHKYITDKETQPFLQANRKLRMLSDWFRYRLMYDRGGWWVDTDTILIPDNPIPKGEYVFFWQNEGSLANGIFRVPKNAPLMLKMDGCFSRIGEERPWADNRYYTAATERAVKNKTLTADVLKAVARNNFAGPYWFCYAVESENLQEFIRRADKEPVPEANGLGVGWEDAGKLFDGSLSYQKDIVPSCWNLHLYGYAIHCQNLWNKKTDSSVVAELIRMYGTD